MTLFWNEFIMLLETIKNLLKFPYRYPDTIVITIWHWVFLPFVSRFSCKIFICQWKLVCQSFFVSAYCIGIYTSGAPIRECIIMDMNTNVICLEWNKAVAWWYYSDNNKQCIDRLCDICPLPPLYVDLRKPVIDRNPKFQKNL